MEDTELYYIPIEVIPRDFPKKRWPFIPDVGKVYYGYRVNERQRSVRVADEISVDCVKVMVEQIDGDRVTVTHVTAEGPGQRLSMDESAFVTYFTPSEKAAKTAMSDYFSAWINKLEMQRNQLGSLMNRCVTG